MKVLFDTSTLLASLIESHPKFESAFLWLKKVKNKEIEAFISAHSLLEIYSVLTSAPFKPKISPAIAKKLIDVNIKSNFKLITLNTKEYLELINTLSASELKGGIVYDGLILECAVKVKADKLVTANAKDFTKINTQNKIEIVSI